MELPLENWYRLAEVLVKGLEDADELEAWRQWARERARRTPTSAPRTVQQTDLWAWADGLAPKNKRREAILKPE
jgi:hypothetical protein